MPDRTLEPNGTDAPRRGRHAAARPRLWEAAFKAARGLLALVALITITSPALARTVRVVALGDSLTAGYGVAPKEAFPVQLEAALRARGHDVVIENAGVSGETATQGLARLDWSVPEGTDAVILALGANDMLRGLPPKVTRAALTQIVARLKARGITVLVAGMRAAPNLGAVYAAAFDPIFPEVAAEQGVLLYPFFLDGVAGDATLNQKDGLHPNPKGVAVMVAGILPKAEELLAAVTVRANGSN
ncbi:arylesterase [Xanthobacter agilis]|uniref:Acyl-CoA thioesterase-1 n=1 Tax=Xanthobacter agilis TaxID=47492 RepID=A0ABU0L9K8_XANAG|nr:arylesterase [Xanthobacter agilis]MDQ0503829.1 acyl-CoA thioesterase-1 [Xanthobacter agilis]